jgi:AraC family ethanolamine operon transcriptional activator
MTARGLVTSETHGRDDAATEADRSNEIPNYEFSPAGIVRICATDVDEAAEQIRDWRVELTQFERGPAQISGIMIPLGQTLIGRGHCTKALYARGAAPKRSVSFLFKSAHVPSRASALTTDTDTCIVYGSGAQINNYTARDVLTVAVSIASTRWLELEHAFGFRLACGDGESQILTTSPEYSRSISALMDEVCRSMDAAQGANVAPERVAAWEDAVRGIIASMLDSPTKYERPTRDRAGRYRAVRRAQEFIHENLGEHLSLLALCDASLASARTLEYGFRELFGISPLTYVRYERLGRVHRELYRAQRSEASVTDVAMRWGFWHLGQFSKEYRGLFGECPSETLSRSRNRNIYGAFEAVEGGTAFRSSEQTYLHQQMAKFR